MRFSHKKLPREAALHLRNCPVNTVAPYALMLSPVYVYLRRNAKFVAIKAPLDFFTPTELERLKPMQSFFLPECVDSALLFREAGRRIRALLSWNPEKPRLKQDPLAKDIPHSPAPHELSDAILRILGPLWSPQGSIELFFVAVFANELCALLPAEVLHQARNESVEIFEKALFHSSWTVFLALHLGYCELEFINSLRLRVFKETLENIPPRYSLNETDELIHLAHQTLDEAKAEKFSTQMFKSKTGRIAQKLTARMDRVQGSLLQPTWPELTIFGPRGFTDA